MKLLVKMKNVSFILQEKSQQTFLPTQYIRRARCSHAAVGGAGIPRLAASLCHLCSVAAELVPRASRSLSKHSRQRLMTIFAPSARAAALGLEVDWRETLPEPLISPLPSQGENTPVHSSLVCEGETLPPTATSRIFLTS